MEEKVYDGDLEITEEWPSEDQEVNYVEYNGAAFTGTAYDKTDHWYSEQKYLNGYLHGRSFAIYTNGRQCSESFMERGITLEETCWYKSGLKRKYYRKEPRLIQYWSEDGILSEEDDGATHKIYYPSGKPKSVLVKNSEKIYYYESGEWVVKLKTEYSYTVTDRQLMTFNEDLISKNYMGLLRDYDFYGYFIIWLNDKSGDERDDIIIDLIKSDVPWHKSRGINLAAAHNVRKAIQYIRLELSNNVTPPEHYTHRGIQRSSYGWTIGKTAKMALERM